MKFSQKKGGYMAIAKISKLTKIPGPNTSSDPLQ